MPGGIIPLIPAGAEGAAGGGVVGIGAAPVDGEGGGIPWAGSAPMPVGACCAINCGCSIANTSGGVSMAASSPTMSASS